MTSGKKIKGLEITKSDILPNKMLFIGTGARKIISKLGDKNEIVSFFFLKLRKCYLACLKYIQQKLPLEIKVLKSIATIDPGIVVTKSKSVMKCLMNLPSVPSKYWRKMKLKRMMSRSGRLWSIPQSLRQLIVMGKK